MKMIKITKIEAITISDLWFQAIYNIEKEGRKYTIQEGSFKGETRLEYDYFVGTVLCPKHEPKLPIIPSSLNIPAPVTEEYMNKYILYLMGSHKKPNEAYTYGSRLNISKDSMSQIEEIIYRYKKFGYNNNQLILQIATPEDLWLENPPCLRHIDTRIQRGKLHFFVYFRSWDLWAGLPANLVAIQTLKEYMAESIGVTDGSMIVESKGLHIYGYAEELVKLRTYKV